jgi:hypothetical protein
MTSIIVIGRREATKQSGIPPLDCFIATLFAMTIIGVIFLLFIQRIFPLPMTGNPFIRPDYAPNTHCGHKAASGWPCVVSRSASDGGVKKAALSERSEFADFSRRSVKRNERSTRSLALLTLFHQGKRTPPPLARTPIEKKNYPEITIQTDKK